MKIAACFVPQFFLFFFSRILYILFFRRKLMKTKNWLVFGVVSAMTLGMLTGCQSKETAAETEAAQEADNVSEAAEDATEGEAVEDVTEEAAQEVAFAEANGLQFSDLSPLEISGFMYFQDENGNYTEDGPEGVSLIQPTAVYTFGDITVSEPDEDGNVVYTIPLNVELELEALNPNDKDWYYSLQIETFDLMDWYTGTVFPGRDLHGNEGYDIYTDIVWDDVTYSVGYTSSAEWNVGNWQKDGNSYYSSIVEYKVYTVTVPEDYDGLVFFIDNRGRTEYQEDDTELSEAHIFGAEEDGAFDDYTFIRVSDYVTR
jgi:hypothetical protein